MVEMPLERAPGDTDSVRDRPRRVGTVFEQVEQHVAGRLPADEREEAALPRVQFRRVVVGLAVVLLLDHGLLVAEASEVILDLSRCQIEVPDQRVEVASGVALDVRTERLPGRRPGHLRSPPRSRGVRRSVRSRPRR